MFGEANEAKMISWCTSRTVHDPGTNKERKIEDESSKVNEISTPKFFIAGSWGALFFNQSDRSVFSYSGIMLDYSILVLILSLSRTSPLPLRTEPRNTHDCCTKVKGKK